jgi:hypothetical protein
MSAACLPATLNAGHVNICTVYMGLRRLLAVILSVRKYRTMVTMVNGSLVWLSSLSMNRITMDPLCPSTK